MLKSKKAIYILIPLNVLIWSYFIFKIVDGLSGDEVVFAEEGIAMVKNTISQDTQNYVLKLDYEDPFLKGVPKSRSTYGKMTNSQIPKVQKQAKAIKQVSVQPKPAVPEIKFLGLVKNSTSGNITAIVNINGESKLVKPNETISGLHFKSINANELVASFGKETIIVRR